jgi:hypothetical protein
VARFSPSQSAIEIITKPLRTLGWSANLEPRVFPIAERSFQLEIVKKGCMQVVTTIVRVSPESRELVLAVKNTYSFHLS